MTERMPYFQFHIKPLLRIKWVNNLCKHFAQMDNNSMKFNRPDGYGLRIWRVMIDLCQQFLFIGGKLVKHL